MLLGLDHAIIAVRDLASASERLARTLGLSVTPGGEYPDIGSHSAIIRFGGDYLEIISVLRPEVAAANDRGRIIQQYLERQEGFLGFALGSDDLGRDLMEARTRGAILDDPIPGSRRPPDGSTISWRTAVPPNDRWGRRVPFLIQHDSTMQERSRWRPREDHPLRVDCVQMVTVAVADLNAATDEYRRMLGSPPEVVEEVKGEGARRARFCIESFVLNLVQPLEAEGELSTFIGERGEGLFRVTLGVPNAEAAVRLLRERGTAVSDPSPDRTARLLDPSQTIGARFELAQVK
jgi:catechol 2,3-dioxygenase-like lactoylglutathione lyase family enzyme